MQELLRSSFMGYGANAERLIDKGAPTDWQNQYGNAPLHGASLNGNEDTVRLLIERNANLNIANKCGTTPLIFAARTNKVAILRLLVEAGADTTIRGSDNHCGLKNKTALEWAKHSGHNSVIVECLTAIRFQTSSRDESGKLHRVHGRSLRAIERDLKDSGAFCAHVLHRLNQLCKR